MHALPVVYQTESSPLTSTARQGYRGLGLWIYINISLSAAWLSLVNIFRVQRLRMEYIHICLLIYTCSVIVQILAPEGLFFPDSLRIAFSLLSHTGYNVNRLVKSPHSPFGGKAKRRRSLELMPEFLESIFPVSHVLATVFSTKA
jgi:hypothetical protein